MRFKILLLLSAFIFTASFAQAASTLDNRKNSYITINGSMGLDLMRVFLDGYNDLEVGVYLGEKLQLSLGNASGIYKYSDTENNADVDFELTLNDI